MTSTAIREEKAAVVAEVRGKLEAADAAIVAEYRGMSVTALASLRRELRNAGAEFKVYKNTLARFAVREAGFEPFMASAIADKQQWVADQARAGVFAGVDQGVAWQVYADALLAAR